MFPLAAPKDQMARTTFDDFVRRQNQAASQAREINWDRRRDEWLTYLDDLYTRIEAALHDYIEAGQITVNFTTIELNEENIGSYLARQLILKIGGQEIDFKPVGTLLIAAKGRVDVYGPAGTAALILVDSRAQSAHSLVHVSVHIPGMPSPQPPLQIRPEDIQWEWKIVSRPDRRFLSLTDDNIRNLILEVANG